MHDDASRPELARGYALVAARRDEIARLVRLGVAMTDVPASETRRLFKRFVEEFIDPERAAELQAHFDFANIGDRALEMGRMLRPDRTRRADAKGCVRWLDAGERWARCVRFERHLALPALQIALGTLDDTWAASWPGTYVNFEAGRAVVITVDYEDLRCDLRRAPATPYR